MTPEWMVIALTLAIEVVVFLRWLHRRMRDAEIEQAFVRDMATNHLPHIYQALRLICERMEIDWKEPPPVKFLDLDKNK